MEEKIPLIIIALRIIPKTGLCNFRRNNEFYKAFAFFYTKLLTHLNNSKACPEIKQQDNNIIILWDFSEKNIDTLLAEYKKLLSLKRQTNNKFSLCQITYYLTLEAGFCDIMRLTDTTKAPAYLMQSDMIERTQKVLSCLDGKKYPSIMLTHSFYNLLPQYLKQKLPCPYYFFHICCYSIKLPKHS